MAKLGSVNFTGKSGSVYTFAAYPAGTTFNDVGAVYFVTKRSPDGQGGYSHKRIYVGQTIDLSTRFDSHHRQDCFEREGANCICVYVESDEEKQLLIEKDLRVAYDPPCNRE